jgi:Tfp pilus assembly protein PilO
MKARVLELSPEKFAVALGALLVLLGVAAWLILVSPNRTKEHSLSTTIKTEQSTLQKLTTTQSSTAQHAAQNHAVSQALMTSRALPNVVGMPQILLQLSRIATEEHVSLDVVTPAQTVPYSGYVAIPITIQLSGEFFGVQNFLQQLLDQVTTSKNGVTATGRLYDVTSVTIAQATTPPKVTATIILDAFQYVPVVPTVPGSTTGTTTTTSLG